MVILNKLPTPTKSSNLLDSLGCWSYLDPVNSRLKGLGAGLSTPTGHFALSDILYQDAGIYKCIGQMGNTKKKVEVLQTVSVGVKGN